MNEENIITTEQVQYDDDNIRHLSDMEHVRTRPGMYIGRLGDGSLPEDGIYVLLKEVIDNSIDEFKMKATLAAVFHRENSSKPCQFLIPAVNTTPRLSRNQ